MPDPETTVTTPPSPARENLNLAYAAAGVDYSPLDHFKRMAQEFARTTDDIYHLFGFSAIPESRGESALVFNMGMGFGAIVQEGLGTKSLVAEQMATLFPENDISPPPEEINMKEPQTYTEAVAWDSAAMIINDLITVGARPVVLCPHWVAGSTDWFANTNRSSGLYHGWLKAASAAQAIYGPGETAVLPGVVLPNAVELSGSGFGLVIPPERLTLGDQISASDRIVVIESSGIHANGVSLARKIAKDYLKDGYTTVLPGGNLFGDALLKPTHIYAKLQRAIFERGVDIHYMSHITGHGWRKLMRAKNDVTHMIHTLPPVQEEFLLMQRAATLKDEDMYATFNMGAGFAFWVPEHHVVDVQEAAESLGLKSWDAGVVEEGPKQVIIKPKGIIFSQDSLQIR